MSRVDVDQIRNVAGPVLAGLGYALVDLEWKHEAGRWVLRVFLDFAEPVAVAAGEAPASVSHEDCTRASRALSAELDVADTIPVAYVLEVSSPGLDRPLRAEADFRRFVGRAARIKTRHPVAEPGAAAAEASRRNFRGQIAAVDAGRVKIEVDGRLYEIPVDDVEKANLEFEF